MYSATCGLESAMAGLAVDDDLVYINPLRLDSFCGLGSLNFTLVSPSCPHEKCDTSCVTRRSRLSLVSRVLLCSVKSVSPVRVSSPRSIRPIGRPVHWPKWVVRKRRAEL